MRARGGSRPRYSLAVDMIGPFDDISRSTMPSQSTPSNHQCPKSSLSNVTASKGSCPSLAVFESSSRTTETKWEAWSRARSAARPGE